MHIAESTNHAEPKFTNGSNTCLEEMRLIGCGATPDLSPDLLRCDRGSTCTNVGVAAFRVLFTCIDNGHDAQHAVRWKAYRWSVIRPHDHMPSSVRLEGNDEVGGIYTLLRLVPFALLDLSCPVLCNHRLLSASTLLVSLQRLSSRAYNERVPWLLLVVVCYPLTWIQN